jgi:hypothetical protein
MVVRHPAVDGPNPKFKKFRPTSDRLLIDLLLFEERPALRVGQRQSDVARRPNDPVKAGTGAINGCQWRRWSYQLPAAQMCAIIFDCPAAVGTCCWLQSVPLVLSIGVRRVSTGEENDEQSVVDCFDCCCASRIHLFCCFVFDRLAAAQEAAAQHAEEEERRNRSGGVLGLGHLPYLGASSRSSFLGGGSGYGSGSPSTAAGMGSKRAASAAAAAAGHGPTSLFILTEKNIIRRYTRFIIEWPYPFPNELLSH